MNIVSFIFYCKRKPALQSRWLFLVIGVLLIPQVIISYGIVQHNINQDLHSRIIGSRLLQQNHSPYFYTWQAGDDERLYNPNLEALTQVNQLNGVTITPFALWLQLPLASMPYCSVKKSWWLIEELLLLGCLFFACKPCKRLHKQMLTLLIALLGFAYSRNWWLHVYSGQYYVVLAFLLAAGNYFAARKKEIPLYVYPVFALVKPFYMLALLPWCLQKIKQWFMPLLTGCLVAVVFLLGSNSHHYLVDYSKAMRIYASENIGWQASGKLIIMQPNIMEPCVVKANSFMDFGTGCLYAVQHYLYKMGWPVTNPAFFIAILITTLIIFALVHRKKITASVENILIASFLVYMLCELFTPAIRNAYNLIEYAAILGVFINKASWRVAILFVVGLAFNLDIPFRFSYQRELGELMMLLAIYFALLRIIPTAKKPG